MPWDEEKHEVVLCRFQWRYDKAGLRVPPFWWSAIKGLLRVILQHRIAAQGLEGTVLSERMDVAISLVTEELIQFYPWCGCNLNKWYRRDIDAPGLSYVQEEF